MFENSILPELLGQWFSRPTEDTVPSISRPKTNHIPVVQVPDDAKHCYCQEGEHGKMVGCDNSDCRYQWFQLDCLNLTKPPKGKIWYCPDCRKLDKRSRRFWLSSLNCWQTIKTDALGSFKGVRAANYSTNNHL